MDGATPSAGSLRLAYAFHGAKDSIEIEALNGHPKGEGHSSFLEARTLTDLREVADQGKRYYSTQRLRSSIGYVMPVTTLRYRRWESADGTRPQPVGTADSQDRPLPGRLRPFDCGGAPPGRCYGPRSLLKIGQTSIRSNEGEAPQAAVSLRQWAA